MSLNKIILSIVLSISFHGTVMSMENQSEREKQLEVSAKEMSHRIFLFSRDFTHNTEHMELLGRWLTVQRTAISETNKWNTLVNHVTDSVTFCKCICLKHKTTAAVRDAVKKIAQDLQPGQHCSQLLINRAQEAVMIAEHEWKEEQLNIIFYNQKK